MTHQQIIDYWVNQLMLISNEKVFLRSNGYNALADKVQAKEDIIRVFYMQLCQMETTEPIVTTSSNYDIVKPNPKPKSTLICASCKQVIEPDQNCFSIVSSPEWYHLQCKQLSVEERKLFSPDNKSTHYQNIPPKP